MSSKDFLLLSIIVVVIFSIVMFFSFLSFAYYMSSDNPDLVRQGHEAQRWKDRVIKMRKTVKFIGWMLTICLTGYIVVGRV